MPASKLYNWALLSVVVAVGPIFTAGPAHAQALDIGSQVDELEVMRLSDLPVNSTPPPEGLSCPPTVDPQTLAARRVAFHGWAVTGEVGEAGLTFVSFVGNSGEAAGQSCETETGAIGIFQGETLLALIEVRETAAWDIGRITHLDGGGLRIWGGDMLQLPKADLQVLASDLVVVRPVAYRDSFCGGVINAPNLRGLPIRIARRVLLAEGWAPHIASETQEVTGLVPKPLKIEFPELLQCDSTGQELCVFEFTKDTRPVLKVVTFGTDDDAASESVIDVFSDCSP